MPLLRWDALAFVFHLQADLTIGTSNTNSGDWALGMAVNIGEALLNDPENGGFEILRETS